MNKIELSYNTYLDKVHACWLGKSLGGVIGALFEGHKYFEELSPDGLWPAIVYPNDDLDIQVVWLEMLEDLGPEVTHDRLTAYWRDHCWYHFAEYGSFLYNAQRGILPPDSGRFNNFYFSESEGCPIRAEIWGLTAPCNPALAAEHAWYDGTLDHQRTSVYAEMFWAAANAHALGCSDLDEVVNAALMEVPEDCEIQQIAADVRYAAAELKTLREMYLYLVRRWGDSDSSKSQINFAFSLLPLYYGGSDFKKVMACCCSLTFDTDCTAATACSLLGTMHGTGILPEDWLDKLGKDLTCDVAVRHKEAPIIEFARDTAAVGIEGLLGNNTAVYISGIPEDVRALVRKRFAERKPLPRVEIVSGTEPEDVITPRAEKGFGMSVCFINSSPGDLCGVIKAESLSPHLRVSPALEADALLPAGGAYEKTFTLTPDFSEGVIWDKNLVRFTFEGGGQSVTRELGVVGARCWQVYGPYWDIYDTAEFDECPYRNDKVCNHPGRLGYGQAGTHQYVRLDREYLDEKTLAEKDLPGEYPFDLNLAEDLIRKEDISFNMGESCYYFVREFITREHQTSGLMAGASGPFKVWINGKLVFENPKNMPYAQQDWWIPFEAQPDTVYRVVVKALQLGSDFKFSLSPRLDETKADHIHGISYLSDSFGNKYWK
ncbi:MAG: ADP-ribosylglycohydrolase family protein [Abditibacteriota bacterium]|nr:ADP-ribosylglycohydrolase family protein [Abditibacteriota bacterium]